MAAQTEYPVPRLPRLAGDPMAAAIVGDETKRAKFHIPPNIVVERCRHSL